MHEHEVDDATDQAVEEAERHGLEGSPRRSCLVKLGSGYWTLRVSRSEVNQRSACAESSYQAFIALRTGGMNA
jgi:hypothetical protein